MALHYESMVHNIEFDHGATESRRRAEHARAYLPPEGGSYKRILALARWHSFQVVAGRRPTAGTGHGSRSPRTSSRVLIELVLGDRDPCRPRERGPATSIRA